jgi:hypothetical protein
MANTEARMAAESIGTERSHAKPMAVHDIPWPLEGTNKKHKKCSRCRFFWNQMVDSPGNSVQIIDSANSRSHQPSTINHQPTINHQATNFSNDISIPAPNASQSLGSLGLAGGDRQRLWSLQRKLAKMSRVDPPSKKDTIEL